jgi:hypothetical protein
MATNKTTLKKAAKRSSPLVKLGDRGLPIWPKGKLLPNFKSYADEVKFWHSWDFEPPGPDEGEEVVYEPQATRVPRKHVLQTRFDDLEMGKLQAAAKRRGVSIAGLMRELVRHHL